MMECDFLCFLNNYTLYNWVDLGACIFLIIFVVFGIMHGISGGISKLIAYLTTFAIALFIYKLLRNYIFESNVYSNQIISFVIAVIIGLFVGVMIGMLVAKYLRVIVSQPYDSIIGSIASFVCYSIILLAILFLLKIVPLVNTEKIREQSVVGKVGYTLLDNFLVEQEENVD